MKLEALLSAAREITSKAEASPGDKDLQRLREVVAPKTSQLGSFITNRRVQLKGEVQEEEEEPGKLKRNFIDDDDEDEEEALKDVPSTSQVHTLKSSGRIRVPSKKGGGLSLV